MDHQPLIPGSSYLARLAICATLLLGLALLPGSGADPSRLNGAALSPGLQMNPGTTITATREPGQETRRGSQISLMLFRFR